MSIADNKIEIAIGRIKMPNKTILVLKSCLLKLTNLVIFLDTVIFPPSLQNNYFKLFSTILLLDSVKIDLETCSFNEFSRITVFSKFWQSFLV